MELAIVEAFFFFPKMRIYRYNQIDQDTKRTLEVVRLLIPKEIAHHNDGEDQDNDVEWLEVKVLDTSEKMRA